MKEQKLTVIGDIDPINVVGKLRKLLRTEILTVGPAKEPEKKKEEPKKEEPKKEEPKKEEPKKEEPKKEEKKEPPSDPNPGFPYKAYPPYPYYTQYHAPSVEENPNACVIC